MRLMIQAYSSAKRFGPFSVELKEIVSANRGVG